MAANTELERLGERISRMRRERDMTPFDLAAESDIDLGLLEKLERGEAAPTVKHVISLARSLMVSPEYLLGLSASPDPGPSGAPTAPPEGTIDALESVLNNETGWHSRGFLAPTEMEKQTLRDGLTFTAGRPRELVQFYWDIVPFILTYLRAHPGIFSADINGDTSS